jgi:hypothetical protein
LFETLKKGEFCWGPDQLVAFETIKKAICSAPVLALPNFTKAFILGCDASEKSIGAVLMQEGRPLAYFSKSLGKQAAKYSTYDNEAMAIIEALKKWKHYLAESSLILRTDQQSLKYMGDQRLVPSIQHKLMVKLMGYDYKIEYKKGKENRAANALSRRPATEFVRAISTTVPLWVNDVQASYVDDPKFKELEQQLHVKPDSVTHYTLTNGLIRYKGRLYIGSYSDLKNNPMHSFHSLALGGHSGDKVTYYKLKSLFHWPGMKGDVTTFIKNCPTYQKNKAENVPYPGLLQPIPIPGMAWQLITMDSIEALPRSEGKDTILVVVDKLTKYAHFISLSHPFTTKTIVQIFIDNVFKLHGLPLAIITDKDRIFTSQLWQDLFKSLNVKLIFSSACHPQTDGQSKRVNQ